MVMTREAFERSNLASLRPGRSRSRKRRIRTEKLKDEEEILRRFDLIPVWTSPLNDS
jgi:hypothetical protein